MFLIVLVPGKPLIEFSLDDRRTDSRRAEDRISREEEEEEATEEGKRDCII